MEENKINQQEDTEQTQVDEVLDNIVEESISLDDALAQKETEILTETVEKEDKKPAKKGFTLKKLVIICISVILAIGIFIGGFGLLDYSGVLLKKEISIEVEKGSVSSQIAEQLKESGVIRCPIFFRIYSRIKGYDIHFKYGNYKFGPDMGYSAICDKLMYEGAIAPSVTVTIPEGTGIYDYTKDVNGKDVAIPGIATLLENAGVCTKADFYEALDNVKLEGKLLSGVNKQAAYEPLEGYLFADTYDFYYYDSKECARLAVEKMLSQSEKKITEQMYNRASELGMSMNEILTMASIIQMEAGANSEFAPQVAAVFYNRLKSDNFVSLGSSPTCYYGNAFDSDDGRYNTYNIKGLPPGPLCSPSLVAINAALYPTENSPYYYFVTDSKGVFYFHKTSAEQDNTIARLQREGNWIYEYF